MPLDLTTLNPAQLEAVLATDGPLLVLAGAGSGKTRVLTYRIAHLVEDLGVSPYQVLAITFTNKAAAEMRARLGQLLPGGTRGMWVSTFHSMCVRMLREDAELLGYTRNFTIYDDYDSKRLMREVFAELGIDLRQLGLGTARERISLAKNELLSPLQFAETVHGAYGGPDALVAEVYPLLQQRLHQADAMDFDDLLFNAWRLLDVHPEVLQAYQQRFRYILVDEYQDTNHAQYQLTALLSAAHRNLMVVGDDDQSIYSWRGADIRNILEFERDYPEAKVVKLEQNYRSTARILKAANAVIAQNPDRKPKELFTEGATGDKISLYLASDERDEGRWLASEVERLHRAGRPYANCAVFYRTNAQSRVLEDMLIRAGVPYRIVGGTRFYDRAEIRDVMAYLKLVVNPADDLAAKRVVNVPRRGIGAKSVAAIESLAADEGVNFLEACELILATNDLGPKARVSLARFVQLLYDARQYRGSLRDIIEMIVERSGYIEALEADGSDESLGRIENVMEFYSIAADYIRTSMYGDEDEGEGAGERDGAGEGVGEGVGELEGAGGSVSDGEGVGAGEGAGELESEGEGPGDGEGAAHLSAESEPAASGAVPLERVDASDPLSADVQLVSFMEWLALRTDLDSLDDASDYVTLMTVHSAKGLEFPVVFITGMEDGLFPHFAALDDLTGLEEERRLAYVAITRAEELLYMSYAQQRSIWGKTQSNASSVFLDDIPEDCIVLAGVGSQGFSGTGWEKRGDRRGTFGSGTEFETTGRVFGSGRAVEAAVAAAIASERSVGQQGDASGGQSAEDYFSVGDRVDHKAFGIGRVDAVEGDNLTITFEGAAGTKKLAFGFAPLVKIG